MTLCPKIKSWPIGARQALSPLQQRTGTHRLCWLIAWTPDPSGVLKRDNSSSKSLLCKHFFEVRFLFSTKLGLPFITTQHLNWFTGLCDLPFYIIRCYAPFCMVKIPGLSLKKQGCLQYQSSSYIRCAYVTKKTLFLGKKDSYVEIKRHQLKILFALRVT